MPTATTILQPLISHSFSHPLPSQRSLLNSEFLPSQSRNLFPSLVLMRRRPRCCSRGCVLEDTHTISSFSSLQLQHMCRCVYILLSLTMYPITPMIRKPMPTAWLMRRNSRRSAKGKHILLARYTHPPPRCLECVVLTYACYIS